MLDFYLKNQILVFIIISVFILYSVRFANSPQLLNAILIITIIYYIFFSDTINLKNINSNTNPDRFLHKYPEIYDIKTKLYEPEEVLASTNQYRREQDIIREYYDSCIEIANDMKEGIKKRDLTTHFKMWFKEEHEGSFPPKQKTITDYIEKTLKHKYTSIGFVNLKFKKEIGKETGEIMDEHSTVDALDA